MTVQGPFAEWLRSSELIEEASDAATQAAWGELAVDGHASSALALRADAAAEGQRQLQFFGSPVTVETVEVTGRHADKVGQCRRIQADDASYAAAPPVFIIGAEEQQQGTTLLTVLRRVEAA